MPPARTSSLRLHLALRWLLFVGIMAGMGWLYVRLADHEIRQAAQREPTTLETRHLALTEATQTDFQPDFSRSVSDPLKKLAPYRTDGIAQPLWPWVAAWGLDQADLPGSMASLAWFKTGLTLGCLAMLGLACARKMALPAALLVVALTGFYGLLGTLPQFTGGTLFHVCFLLTWLACLYGLHRNSLWVYAAVGVFGALAYLAEDRILPLLAVFVTVSTLRAMWGWLAEHWCTGEGTTLWVPRNQVFGVLLLAAGLLSIAGPRLTEADRQFGDGLFQYGDHVRWLDDKTAAAAWIQDHPDKASLHRIPKQEWLSARNYLENHSLPVVQERLQSGLKSVLPAWPGQGGNALGVLLALLVVLTVASWGCTPKACHPGEKLHPETVTTVLFVAGVTLAYGVGAAWDAAVVETNHLPVLTGPLALSLAWGAASVLRRAQRRAVPWWLARLYQAALWILLGAVLLKIWQSYGALALQGLP